MALISLKNLSYAFGGPPLLDNLDFHIQEGERVALIGRNGAGKTTLMRILNGDISPDSGDMAFQQGVSVSRLEQEVPGSLGGTCMDLVLGGLGPFSGILASYHELSSQVAAGAGGDVIKALTKVQHQIEENDGWTLESRADAILNKLGIDPKLKFAELSGGRKRQVLLARALVGEPDVLLLDEPTNHLDIHAIRWMESFFLRYRKSILFVTHDRAFLRSIATRIVELDRGRVRSWDCNYRQYLERREGVLEAEQKANADFDKRLSQEETWIRKGIKARRTRNEGRVRSLFKMRSERQARRDLMGQVKLELNQSAPSGRIVATARNVSFGYEDSLIVKDFSTIILRGDRIGLVGPNGSGKTTLINLLLGRLKPKSGTLVQGVNLDVSYFDQLRGSLVEEKTVLENLDMSGDAVNINGKSRHIMGYLQDFLFSPQQIRNPVSYLSGGEKNRLLLAKLFTRPSNVLVLDEPTNDLDIETLELFEELLMEYTGTVLLVSHDRAFVNNVATFTLVLEGDGSVGEYAGGYDSWLKDWDLRQKQKEKKPTQSKPQPLKTKPVKLSFKETRELEGLPGAIEVLEKEMETINRDLGDPAVYRERPQEVSGMSERLSAIEKELEILYTRWEDLESKTTE